MLPDGQFAEGSGKVWVWRDGGGDGHDRAFSDPLEEEDNIVIGKSWGIFGERFLPNSMPRRQLRGPSRRIRIRALDSGNRKR